MHHGQTRGKRKTHKVCKKHVNFTKSRGEICKSRGEIIIFPNRGKCTETAKIGGNSKFVVNDKKGHQKFLRMKIENCLGKEKIGKIFHGVRKMGRKSETGREMYQCLRAQRDGRP